MLRIRSVIILVVMTGACAARASAPAGPEPGSDPSLWSGDVQLYRILNNYPLVAALRDSLTAYLTEHEVNADELLVEAAGDTSTTAAVRANALMTLAERKAATYLRVFRLAMTDADPRVRATAVAAMREFMEAHEDAAVRLARAALSDPDPVVQAQALQVIGERDVELLRQYRERAPNPELRAVATDLIAVAETRGAPLLADSATGVLRRATPHGYTVTFTPTQRWPQWQAAVGDVTVARGTRTLQRLTGIEAVAGVLPVFFSSTGSHIVYERDRQIVVRDVASGTERVVGPGIAPRPLPFTDDFLFVRETPNGQTPMRDRTRIEYLVLRAPFAGAAAADTASIREIGGTQATTSFGTHGNYSPVRWMRIEERAGRFYLTGQGLEQFELPDPFSSARGG